MLQKYCGNTEAKLQKIPQETRRFPMPKDRYITRRPDHKEGVKNDNNEQTLLKPEFLRFKCYNKDIC